MQGLVIYVFAFDSIDSDAVMASVGPLWGEPEKWRASWRESRTSIPHPLLRRFLRLIQRVARGLPAAYAFAVATDRCRELIAERLDGAGLVYRVEVYGG